MSLVRGCKTPLARGGGQPLLCCWGPRGERGGSAFGEAGGEPRGHVFSPPPKELNASQMQPALECNQVSVGASCRMQTAVEGLSGDHPVEFIL
jgi:hypothetical protein